MEWDEQKRFLNSQLAAGESLLWSGRPRAGIFLRPSDLYAIPASLLAGGFATVWVLGVTYSNAPYYFRFFAIPALIYSAYWLVGRFFVDAWQRSKTYYGVTNERVIIISGIFSKNVKSLNLRSMTEMSLSERKDLSGTITFGPEDDVSDWRSKLPFETRNNKMPVYPILDSITNAKRVYDIIREAQKAAG